MFLVVLSDNMLSAAGEIAKINAPLDPRIQGIELLLSAAPDKSEEISVRLADADPVLRRYAAAARIARRAPGPLIQATQSEDPAIKEFAQFMAKERV